MLLLALEKRLFFNFIIFSVYPSMSSISFSSLLLLHVFIENEFFPNLENRLSVIADIMCIQYDYVSVVPAIH